MIKNLSINNIQGSISHNHQLGKYDIVKNIKIKVLLCFQVLELLESMYRGRQVSSLEDDLSSQSINNPASKKDLTDLKMNIINSKIEDVRLTELIQTLRLPLQLYKEFMSENYCFKMTEQGQV